MPRQFLYSSTNKSNTYTEGPSTSVKFYNKFFSSNRHVYSAGLIRLYCLQKGYLFKKNLGSYMRIVIQWEKSLKPYVSKYAALLRDMRLCNMKILQGVGPYYVRTGNILSQ